MPTGSEERRAAARKRGRRYTARKREERIANGTFGRDYDDMRGPNNPRWNNGEMVTSQGYVMIRVDEEHPHRFGNGYAYKHHVVAMEKFGRHACR